MCRPSLLLPLFFALSACAAAPPRPRARTHRARHPQVVVTIVIDQFAAWVAEQRLPELPPDGGFARLRREGTWARHARFEHSATDTAPGHASLYTAVPPHESGIFGNEVIGADGEKVSILRDANSRVVSAHGPTERVGSSIVRLRVPTLADRLREHRPDAVIVSLSLKDRGAIFGGGRSPDAVLWLDTALDHFVTSTAFAQALPAWSLPLGGTDALRARRTTPWTPLDEPWLRAHAATPDAQPGEGDLVGFGVTFPHDFAHTGTNASVAMRASPVGDDALIDLALSAVERARRPEAPMLLAVSLSSNDYIGHVFGPDSWEAWDELRRLDVNLARLFRGLDAAVGANGWSVVLSADHGTVTMPEAAEVAGARPWCQGASGQDPYERPCGALSRIIPEDWARELQTASQSFGAGAWVLGIADPFVYLSPAAHALPPERRQALYATLIASLRAHAEVLDVIDPRAEPPTCAGEQDVSISALVCRSVPRAIDGDLYILTRPGAFFDPGYTPGHGTSHGSPFLYDRTVPVLARAPGAIAAGRTLDAPQRFTIFADTAAALLGLPYAHEHPSPLVR